ncbi:hypothetical protein HDU67_008848 [Dinochytrium kinnereticum]|nr:hypothetical protein HDU67_008848 [Dinochytrium kinnereticum]
MSSEIIAFLAEVFPHLSATDLRSHLTAAGDDVERCIERLSIDSQIPEGDHGEIDALLSLGIDPVEILHSKFPGIPAASLKATIEECGDDVLSAIDVLSSGAGNILLSNEGGGADLALLQALFPTRQKEDLLSALKSYSNRVDEAAEFLIRSGVPESAVVVVPALAGEREYDVQTMKEMFPEFSVAHLRDILRIQGGLHNSINYLAEITDMADRAADPDRPRKSSHKKDDKALFSTTASHQRNGSGSPMLGFKSKELPKVVFVRERTADPFGEDSASDFDPEYCRQMAAEHYQKRGDAFQRAASSFKKGNLTGRGTASYYAQMGQEETKSIEHWNKLAAAAIIKRNAESHKHDVGSVVDLHGLTKSEALKAIDHYVNEWYNSKGANSYPSGPLKVITGSGSHSKKNEPILLPAVLKHLRKAGWKTCYEPGQVRTDMFDEGARNRFLRQYRSKLSALNIAIQTSPSALSSLSQYDRYKGIDHSRGSDAPRGGLGVARKKYKRDRPRPDTAAQKPQEIRDLNMPFLKFSFESPVYKYVVAVQDQFRESLDRVWSHEKYIKLTDQPITTKANVPPTEIYSPLRLSVLASFAVGRMVPVSDEDESNMDDQFYAAIPDHFST